MCKIKQTYNKAGKVYIFLYLYIDKNLTILCGCFNTIPHGSHTLVAECSHSPLSIVLPSCIFSSIIKLLLSQGMRLSQSHYEERKI